MSAQTPASILAALGFPPLSTLPTAYLCQLTGIIEFADRGSSFPSLFNLLDLLASLCESSSIESFDLSHERIRSAISYPRINNFTDYAIKYGFPDSERKFHESRERGDRFLQSRVDSLNNLPGNFSRRVFGQYTQVYSPANFVDSSRSEAQLWREIVPGFSSLPAAFSDFPESSNEKWYFNYIGRPLNAAKNETLVRPIYGMPVSASFKETLESIGYSFNFEFGQIGFFFAEIDKIEIRIYQLYRFEKTGDFTTAHSVKGVQSKVNRWIVEIRSLAAEEELSKVQQKLLKLAKSLDPIVKFTKAPPNEG